RSIGRARRGPPSGAMRTQWLNAPQHRRIARTPQPRSPKEKEAPVRRALLALTIVLFLVAAAACSGGRSKGTDEPVATSASQKPSAAQPTQPPARGQQPARSKL